MKKVHGKTVIYILLILLPLMAFLIYNYFFNIYEVDYRTSDNKIFADGVSTYTIEVVPLNGLGTEVPFRKVKTQFEIVKGKELIEISKMDSENGILIIKAQNRTGEVEILVKPSLSLLPTKFIVYILPNYA